MIDASQLSPMHSADESPDVCKYFMVVYRRNFPLHSVFGIIDAFLLLL